MRPRKFIFRVLPEFIFKQRGKARTVRMGEDVRVRGNCISYLLLHSKGFQNSVA